MPFKRRFKDKYAGSSPENASIVRTLFDLFLNFKVFNSFEGLSSFVGNVALPALLFKSMLTLKLETLNWDFLLTVFAAKSFLFFITCILTSLLFFEKKLGE